MTRTRARAAAVDRLFAALADPSRRRVIELLRERPQRAGALAEAARLSPAAMSRHLKTLRRSGLVTEDRDASDSRVRIYRLQPKPIDDLKSWLGETEALWLRQLASFRNHIEKKG